MNAETQTARTFTFRVVGRAEPMQGKLKNMNATLGAVAGKLAQRLGVAGRFECLDPQGQVLQPECRLADLPADEITLAPELTPA